MLTLDNLTNLGEFLSSQWAVGRFSLNRENTKFLVELTCFSGNTTYSCRRRFSTLNEVKKYLVGVSSQWVNTLKIRKSPELTRLLDEVKEKDEDNP